MKTLHAVIRTNTQNYDVYGLERIEPMENHPDGLFFYFQEKMDGLYTQSTRQAKVVSVSLCDLGNEFTSNETKKALGFIRLERA